jgi:DNA (cytosine-5)-methyltransferase 1
LKIRKLDDEVSLVSGSLFSGGGVGDAGIEWGAKIPVLAACELVPSRAALIRSNFPSTKVFEGDIWKLQDAYVRHFKSKLGGKRPWLLTLSPPCQGMSSNGAGRISAAIRSGNRPEEDERNRLILPGINVLEQLQPDWFILENVRRMENTIIRNEKDEPENILDCLARRLHPLGYSIRANILDFRAYGVPHHRSRLISVGCRIPSLVQENPPIQSVFSRELSPFHPLPTHGGEGRPSFVSLRQSIGDLPPLNARDRLVDSNDPYHCVPKWNDRQYFWMEHTPEGQTAFDNDRCPDCGNMSTDRTLVSCSCGFSLPRPQVSNGRETRLIRGFRSSYRRMWWDRPGGTLTMNSGVISSDLKGHPEQNRVLSIREILLLSTLEHANWNKIYSFEGIKYGRMKEDEEFSKKLVREVIGESIPPLAMLRIVERLAELDNRF